MGEGESYVKRRPAESDDANTVLINEGAPVELINRALEGCHAARTFRRSIDVLPIFAGLRRVSNLENHDSLSGQRLRGEGAVQRTIHGEAVFVVTVSLDDERIPLA